MAEKKEVAIETKNAAPAAKEVKVEVKTAAKTASTPAAKEAKTEDAPAKAAKTTTAKKTTAKKTTTRKTTTKKAADKKAAEPKKATETKKASVPTAVKNAGVFVQYDNKENELNALKERIVEHWCATENKKPSAIKEMSIYIKPEDNAVYYVINGQGSSIEL